MSSASSSDQQQQQQRHGPVRVSTTVIRPTEPEHLHCPRCDSTNTKFCYYNNYNLSQPRHFCKSCRRYWTRGGALRNVPVGGGSRKSSAGSSQKRPRNTTATSVSSTTSGAPATATATASGPSSSSENIAQHGPWHANPVSSMMSQMSSGSVPESASLMGCDVNLNEAVPEAPSSLLTTHVTGGVLPFGSAFGLGLGQGINGVGCGLGALDWPMEPIAQDPNGSGNSNTGLGGGGGGGGGPGDGGDGNVLGSGGSSSGGCNTRQPGDGVEASLGGKGGDCFGWPDLAISMSGKGLK